MEREWAKALKNGKEVEVDVVYSGNSAAPVSLLVEHKVDGIQQALRVFDN